MILHDFFQSTSQSSVTVKYGPGVHLGWHVVRILPDKTEDSLH